MKILAFGSARGWPWLVLLLLAPCSAAPARAQTPVWAREQAKRPQVRQPAPRRENPGEPRSLVLPDGMPVKLKLRRDLSSATERVGATVDFEVLEPVVMDEKIVIQQGAIALGTVIEAEPKRRMGRTGKLSVRIDSVFLADGQRVPLRAVNAGADGSRVGTVTTAATAVGIVFFPAAPLFLLMKGKDITIPAGTFATAYVSGETRLDPEKFTIPAEKAVATVNFKMEKAAGEGAEIWIEEKFAGNLPATIKLPEGEYQVVVQKSGYQKWKRSIVVTAGSLVNITISLEKLP
ncbi:MAG TPA: PEGA domain-containing protein [Blastocatellia bacterium]|nr:PEGA domain-containing protein [Blastocatellia bacterium]